MFMTFIDTLPECVVIPPKYSFILPDFTTYTLLGTPTHEQSKHWAGVIISGGGKFVGEGVTVIDYGCGSSRCGNYLSGILKDFLYVGLEINTPHGNEMLAYNRSIYKDPRFIFGHCDSELEKEMLQKASIVYLGSVFTHTLIEETYRILDKLMTVINNGGVVVFSFIEGAYHCTSGTDGKGDNAYGNPKGANCVWNTIEQFTKYANEHGLVIGVCGKCSGLTGPSHIIATYTKKVL
jgi:hypothetical protein